MSLPSASLFFLAIPGCNPNTPTLRQRSPASAPSIVPRLRAQEALAPGPGEGGSVLTACHSPAAQRCVGHAGRWQSRCAGGRLAGSHSASSAAFGPPLWHCTERRWTPRPQDTEHCRKGQKVSGAPRDTHHGKFRGFSLCSGLQGIDSDALSNFQVWLFIAQGKTVNLKPGGIFAVGFSGVRTSRTGFLLQNLLLLPNSGTAKPP